MTEQITTAELAKAAHNLERLAEFVGVRRRWTLGEGGASAAKSACDAGEAIAELICEMTGGAIATPDKVAQPAEQTPAAEVSASRLARFADYLGQLRRWFDAHKGVELPSESADKAWSIQRSLAATIEALGQLLEEKAPVPLPEPEAEPTRNAFDEPEPLTRTDLGPIADVDPNARLILDHTWQNSLLQKRGNMMELTPKTVEKLDEFFGDQGVELNSHEKRRLHEKVKRWIESTPNKRVLVLRMSGLFGKADVVSSFQPKEDEDDPAKFAAPMRGFAVAHDPEDESPEDESPVNDN